jgi:hypothetical protein
MILATCSLQIVTLSIFRDIGGRQHLDVQSLSESDKRDEQKRIVYCD